MGKEGGVRSARSGKDLHACLHTTTQRLTGLNCLPLCVAVLGAPHVICDHAAAAAPVVAGLCTSVALCSPNHGYPADHWGACNRDSRTCHVACVGEPRTEVERYSINFIFFHLFFPVVIDLSDRGRDGRTRQASAHREPAGSHTRRNTRAHSRTHTQRGARGWGRCASRRSGSGERSKLWVVS